MIIDWINYDPSAPNMSYFTIGELVASLALALTFLQITKPITKFRIKAHKFSVKLAALIGLAAILSVFIAAALPFIPGEAYPVISYPVAWEVLAGIILVSMVLRGIYVISTKAKFGKRNARSFWEVSKDFISRSDVSDFNALANEIEPTISSVFHFAGDTSTKAHRNANGYANAVLALWSDKDLCKAISIKAPTTASLVIKAASMTPKGLAVGYGFVSELIHQEFQNQDSTLMREAEFSGIGHFNGLKDLFFGNWDFVSGKYRPLDAWQYHEGDVHHWQVSKYCNCLQIALNAYLESAPNSNAPALARGLSSLSEIASTQTRWIDQLEKSDIRKNSEFTVLYQIEQGLISLIDVAEYHSAKLIITPFNPSTYLKTTPLVGDSTIYGILAYAIYRYLGQLALSKRHDSYVSSCAINLWMKIFDPTNGRLSRSQTEIGQRLIVHLNEKLDDNFRSGRPHYPAVTRLLIAMNGLTEPSTDPAPDIGAAFHNDFMNRLKQYPLVVKNDPKFAADLLPEDCFYDEKAFELRYTPNRVRNDVLTLTPQPSASSASTV